LTPSKPRSGGPDSRGDFAYFERPSLSLDNQETSRAWARSFGTLRVEAMSNTDAATKADILYLKSQLNRMENELDERERGPLTPLEEPRQVQSEKTRTGILVLEAARRAGSRETRKGLLNLGMVP
jgi:hypothetical protein